MSVLSNLARRFWNWVRPGIEVDAGNDPAGEEQPPAPARRSEEHRRKLDACNLALAAAVDARDRLRESASALARQRERCQEDLRATVHQGDAEHGGEHALRLQELLAEETDLEQRLQEAQGRVNELASLREQLLNRGR